MGSQNPLGVTAEVSVVEAAKAPNILEALARGRYLVSRNELGDHAEWTKLVFVLNIESMH